MADKLNIHRTVSRRLFLKASAAMVGSIACGELLNTLSSYGSNAVEAAGLTNPAVIQPEPKILVAYASRCGSTVGVAEAIGDTFIKFGCSVDVHSVKDSGDLKQYNTVVVGSAIRREKWLSEAIEFVADNRTGLSKCRTCYFLTCLTMRQPNQSNLKTALSYLDPVKAAAPSVLPVSIGLFAGALDYKKLSWVLRRVMKRRKIIEGDFRDWIAIQKWAGNILPVKSRLSS